MKNIKSILWVQHEDPSKNGLLIMNGRMVSSLDTDMYDMANQKLFKVYSLSSFDTHIVKNYIKTSSNNYFQLGSSLFKGVVYKSCFNEKDDQGRAIPFMFWHSCSQLRSFTEHAKESAFLLSKSLDGKELDFLEHYIKRIRNRRLCVSILAAIILFLIPFVV